MNPSLARLRRRRRARLTGAANTPSGDRCDGRARCGSVGRTRPGSGGAKRIGGGVACDGSTAPANAPVDPRQSAIFRRAQAEAPCDGIIHGDPHLGNYTIRDDDEINLLDFGCIRVFEPKFVGGVIDLYYALRDGDMDLAVSAYEAWGFKDLTKEALEILNIWAAFLYAPLLEDRPRLIDENNIGQYGQAVAMDVHKRLKEYGGVTPPREFVLMDRAAIGLGSVFLRLNADLNWHRMFMELAEGFDRDRLARQQEEALAVAGLEPGA